MIAICVQMKLKTNQLFLSAHCSGLQAGQTTADFVSTSYGNRWLLIHYPLIHFGVRDKTEEQGHFKGTDKIQDRFGFIASTINL